MGMLKRLLIKAKENDLTSDEYISRLRSKGASIGEGVHFFAPKDTYIDEGNAFLISIGNYVRITRGVTILAHDYAKSVVRMKMGENIGGKAPVKIGNNVFIGNNAVILKGTVIGNDSIIGAGSIVRGNFEGGVIAGNPAKVICSIAEYAERQKNRVIEEAINCVEAIYQNTGRMPTIDQLGNGFAWLYLPRNKDTLNVYHKFFELTSDIEEEVISNFMRTTPEFNSFEQFLEFAIKKRNIKKE